MPLAKSSLGPTESNPGNAPAEVIKLADTFSAHHKAAEEIERKHHEAAAALEATRSKPVIKNS